MATDDNRNLGKNRPAKARGGANRGILIAVILLVLAGGGGGAYYYFSAGASGAAAEEGEQPKQREAVYVDLEPSFIVNFIYKDTLRYLQINVSAMARDDAVVELVNHHMPAIRHQLLMLLSDKSYSELSGKAAKEKLRLEMLVEIRKIIGNSPSGHSVDSVYLTGYVMQ